jgi:hypothetical protein
VTESPLEKLAGWKKNGKRWWPAAMHFPRMIDAARMLLQNQQVISSRFSSPLFTAV